MGADCKSVAKASKVRILDLPPRALKAPDQHVCRSGAFVMRVLSNSTCHANRGHSVGAADLPAGAPVLVGPANRSGDTIGGTA